MNLHPETHNLPSDTTDEQNTEAAAVRRVSLTWEITLALIVLFAIGSASYVSVRVALLYLVTDATASQLAIASTSLTFIFVLASFVTGFFLGHTQLIKTSKT